jgi:acetyl esterase/lipase
MASRSTHVFKTVDKLELKVDIYTRSSDPNPTPSDPERPVVLFLHGGGFVAFNRQHVPPHVVQSCLIRGWTLVSADYRLLPQVKGADILEDIKDAYNFVREKLPGILAGREGRTGPIENIIIVGQSAGNPPLHSQSIKGQTDTKQVRILHT